MATTTGQFSHLLAPGLRKVFKDDYKTWPEEYSQVFNVMNSTRAYEEDLVTSGLGRAERKLEGKSVVYDDPLQGDKKRYTHVTFALGFRVSREAYDDDLYNVFKGMSSQLSRSARQTVEIESWEVFNDAFDGNTYTGQDGQPLCSTAHPLIGSASTLANRPSTDKDLSISSLRTVMEQRAVLLNERGLPANIPGNLLLVSTGNWWAAKEIIGSEYKPYTANNEINVFKDMDLKYMVCHYTTDLDAWFFLAPKMYHDLKFYWRTRPMFENGDDFDTKDAKFTVFMRFSVGFTDWRGVDGTTGE